MTQEWGGMRPKRQLRLLFKRCSSSVAEGITFKHVDVDNFSDVKGELKDALVRSAFVSLDCEFTGLEREKQQGRTMLLSSDERYSRLRRGLIGRGSGSHRKQGYLIVQVGLSCFEWDEARRRYNINAYSFYLSPRPLSRLTGNVKVEHDLHFGCMASALKFLSTHDFDFNKWMNHGVPFMSRAAYATERDKMELRRTHIDEDLEEAKGFLDIWDLLLAARKPLIGHQCLLDFLYLWNQLEGPLPTHLSQFIRSLSSKVSLAIDTKHILSAYPHDLVAVLEGQIRRYQEERLRTGQPDLEEKEAKCKEMLKHLKCGSNMLKSLPLEDLYTMMYPLMKDIIPKMSDRSLNAHDAGADSYMTGVVYAVLHSLLHTPATPPTADFILRNHSRGRSGTQPLGSPSAFSYSNKLHVFASPFSYDTVSEPPSFETTHSTTVVVVPPLGGMLDVNRITQVLSSFNPYADIFWIEFQRIAVVNLHRRQGEASDVVSAFRKEVSPYRWEVHSAAEWNDKTRPPKVSAKGKKGRRKRFLWLRNKLRASRGMNVEITETMNRLQDVKAQSAQRLQELMDAQRDLKKMQGIERALRDAEAKLQSTSSTVNVLQEREAELKQNNSSTEAGKEALEKKTEALSRGLDNYKQQADGLRVQLAEAFARCDKLEKEVKDAQLRVELAELKSAEAAATLTRLQKAQAKKEEQERVIENKKVLKMKQQRAAKQAEAPRQFTKPPPTDDKEQTTPKKADPQVKANNVTEQRPGQWLLEKKEGKKDAPLNITLLVEKKNLTLELRDCRHLRVFINGTVGSVTFTNCEHIHIYCEATVTEPTKTWSWKDTQRVSGPRIFYYGSDKANIKIDVLPPESWPADRKGERYLAARIKKDLDESAKKKVRQLDVVRSLVFFISVALVFQILLSSITQNHLAPSPAQSNARLLARDA
eukprot:TRINITY_DN4019_c0_g1_i3.p2 TRINITY_DN4019_c0_g1~~TRINITY_DN4019_c0_g1_i3.p2  ORF type:complete len:928 (+),score=345.93 TRINITY_DN4019_c0_g1_i3:3800-6583(+)